MRYNPDHVPLRLVGLTIVRELDVRVSMSYRRGRWEESKCFFKVLDLYADIPFSISSIGGIRRTFYDSKCVGKFVHQIWVFLNHLCCITAWEYLVQFFSQIFKRFRVKVKEVIRITDCAARSVLQQMLKPNKQNSGTKYIP